MEVGNVSADCLAIGPSRKKEDVIFGRSCESLMDFHGIYVMPRCLTKKLVTFSASCDVKYQHHALIEAKFSGIAPSKDYCLISAMGHRGISCLAHESGSLSPTVAHFFRKRSHGFYRRLLNSYINFSIQTYHNRPKSIWLVQI